jgi:pimeloyl-ACP methyl ester carboxylesterase
MIVAVVLVAAWIGISLFPGFGGIESAYHPFRSTRAKARYLSFYDGRAERWPLPAETTTVQTSFGRTFVRISGPTGGRPLVLLHGAGGNSLHWVPNIEALSQQYRTFAVDGIYDYGRSVYTRTIESADDFARWLDESFTALDLGDDITLIGLSYGGWLTSQYALRFPGRLDRIVLLAPAGTVLPLSADWILRASLSVVPHRHFTRAFLFWLLEDFAGKDEASRTLLEEEADAVYLAVRSFKLKRLVNPTVLTDSQLRSLAVPALFLVGENEKIYSAERAIQRLNEVAPHINTAIIPDAGHDLTFVQAEMVNREILEFLDHP